MASDIQISMRLPKDLIDRAEALVAVIKKDPAYSVWRISKSGVLRLALIEGLERLEKKYCKKS